MRGTRDSDYPYTTVPNQVHRLFRAQQLHDKKNYDERMTASAEQRAKMENVDYLRPIIADADTGCVLCGLSAFFYAYHQYVLVDMAARQQS